MKNLTLTLFFMLGLSAPTFGQEKLDYQKPPKEILEVADYERAPIPKMDSKLTKMVLNHYNTYDTLEDLAMPELRLAGLRINPITRIESTMSYYNNLTFKDFKSREEKQIQGLPSHARIAYLTWSPDETQLAFTNTTEKGVELWVADMTTLQAKCLTKDNLNATIGRPYTWTKDGKGFIVYIRPTDSPELISNSEVLPKGPIVSISEVGKQSPNRTYQDLLQNPTDEKNFETLVNSELYYIDLEGKATLWAGKDLYTDFSFSPDGEYVLVATFTRPYSYVVPAYRFPTKTVVLTKEGKLVKEINHKPLIESMPKGFMSTYTGKRSIYWRADEPATLYWAEAQDKGDAANQVEYRDFIYQLRAPFDGEPSFLAKTINRYAGITWGDKNTAIVYDQWFDTRNQKTYLIDPSNPEKEAEILFDYNYQDKYKNPGDFDTERNQYDRYVLRMKAGKAYLVGDGFRPDGQFPFVDEYNFKTKKANRIFESKYTDKSLDISRVIDPVRGEYLVRLQSQTEYPNYYIYNAKKRIAPIPVTFFKNPFEKLAGVYKEVIQYKRKDGVPLSGTLYLPADYDRTAKTEKLPMFMWAYPTEYKDIASAGQVTTNPNKFIQPYKTSPIYWVLRGYAVLDDAAFPIVGEGNEEPNDTFIEQLVANAEAAIDAVDKLGYIDRDKVAVGGHSYGAFMTANLLSHCNLFAAGIARSGAYNRTLTPFGFQYEQRTYWDVPEVYNTMSPFMHVDQMKTPLLLIHGANDNNTGTHTMQSERYFNALKGFGAPTRLVLLPFESHSYKAKESIFHMLWEQDEWLDKYVKNRKK